MTAVLDDRTKAMIDMSRDAGQGVGVYGWSPGRGGVHHHRIREPLRVLAEHGTPAQTGPVLTNEILEQVDTVLVHTLHDPQHTEAWHDLADLGTHRLVLDVDDWMWDPDYAPFREHYTPAVLGRLFSNVERAHVVTTPSPKIAEYLSKLNRNVHVLPNTVPAAVLQLEQCGWGYRPAIGWQISDSHVRDVTPDVLAALGAFMTRQTGWDMHTYGSFSVGAPPGIDPARLRHTAWIASVDDYYRTVALTIGLGPLRDTPFNRAKSALRAIEYAALGVVAVLPDLPIYRSWVMNGVSGRLIPKSSKPARTLAGILHELAADPVQVGRMAAAARQLATAWTTEANITKWIQAWQTV